MAKKDKKGKKPKTEERVSKLTPYQQDFLNRVLDETVTRSVIRPSESIHNFVSKHWPNVNPTNGDRVPCDHSWQVRESFHGHPANPFWVQRKTQSVCSRCGMKWREYRDSLKKDAAVEGIRVEISSTDRVQLGRKRVKKRDFSQWLTKEALESVK